MNKEELNSLFDQQAPNYDMQWKKMAPINDGLYFFLEPIFEKLHAQARVLCVGAGTGKEIIFLAQKFPNWNFTIVEPANVMMQFCREAIERNGLTSRCFFHEGYLDSLKVKESHDAATCFNVSHFLLNEEERRSFFSEIASKLTPEGIMVSSDLASDTTSRNYQELLETWLTAMALSDLSDDNIRKMKAAYAKDVAILPPKQVASIIASGGFDFPVQFYQAGLIHAFFAKRSIA